MEFFSPEIADQLQLITFPLEVIGLTLALIEVRFTDLAREVANRIRVESEAFEANLNVRAQFLEKILFFVPSDLRSTFAFLIALLFPLLLILFLPLDSITIPVAVVILLILAIWGSVKWIPERPIGTLGIFIAGMGVLGEAYQFIVQISGT